MDIRELLHNAKPGDEFLTRGDGPRWFVGRTRSGKYVFESKDGTCGTTRDEDGTHPGAYTRAYDIVGVPPKTHTRFFAVKPDSGHATADEARCDPRIDPFGRTLVKVTWTDGEHQQ